MIKIQQIQIKTGIIFYEKNLSNTNIKETDISVGFSSVFPGHFPNSLWKSAKLYPESAV